MPIDSPFSTYSDTTPQKREITDVISMINPSDTPMINAMGGLDGAASKFRFVNSKSTKVEWLEDGLFALVGALDGSIATNTTALTMTDASIYQEGDTLLIDSEYVWVSAVNTATEVVTVTRNFGGTQATHADADVVTIVGQARLEGDDSDDRAFVDITAPYNYTSIKHHEVKVSRTSNQVAQYGIAREFDYQSAKAVPGLLRLLEQELFHGQRKAGSGTTPRSTGGFATFITDNTLSGASLDQTKLENALKLAWNDGGNGPWLAPLSATNVQKVKNFYDNSSYLRIDRAENVVGMTIDAVNTPYGRIDIIPDRWAEDGTIYLVDNAHAGMLTFHPFTQEPLAVSGDYQKGEVVGEFTLCVRQDKAHAKLTSVS
ncbi:MAG: hypothetical protein DRJ03_16520 [Chloroflexi bacterium]|nr:MAG: hypothetical protein DRJ03_16520 [Chloroflexota bacterium]